MYAIERKFNSKEWLHSCVMPGFLRKLKLYCVPSHRDIWKVGCLFENSPLFLCSTKAEAVPDIHLGEWGCSSCPSCTEKKMWIPLNCCFSWVRSFRMPLYVRQLWESQIWLLSLPYSCLWSPQLVAPKPLELPLIKDSLGSFQPYRSTLLPSLTLLFRDRLSTMGLC